MKTCISLTYVLCLLTSGCSLDAPPRSSAAIDARTSSQPIENAESINPDQEQFRRVGTTQE